MDNYICIDGVKVLLNDSQISELRATRKENNMKVYVTYTYNEVIDVPDDATDNEIADICAEKAPREDYDYFRWENY